MSYTPEQTAQRRKQSNEYRARNLRWLYQYLLEHPCVDCGNDDLRVLEFDHVRGEKFTGISTLYRAGCSLQKLQEEVAKCDVRCANCHRIRTLDERDRHWRLGDFNVGTGTADKLIPSIKITNRGYR